MNQPHYMPNPAWRELCALFAAEPRYAAQIGIEPCPFSGRVEEYQLLDRLGGIANIWPERFRPILADVGT